MSEKKLKIFIVEDDQDLCRAWGRLFTVKGHDFTIKQSSKDALAHKEEIAKSDIFITDYYLPDSNGVELSKKVREFSSVPLVLLTGSKEEELVKEASQVENMHVLHKPILFKTLEERIIKLTSKN